jgi:hypothetical protein
MGIGSNVGKVILADGDSGWSGSFNVDTVNFVEGTASLGEKVSNATVQNQTVNTTDVIGEPFDFSASGGNDGDHVFAWLNIFAAWDTLANGGFGIAVVDDLATDSSGTWYVGPQSGYLGGWASYVINPSADFDVVVAGSASWTTTGNPSQLSGVDGFGARWKTTVTITGNTDNAFVDAMAVGQGYRITLGDGASTEGAFSDFVTFEDNVTNGRFGGLREVSGILFAKSKLLVGAATGNTEFIDSGFTVVWEQQTLSDGATSAVAAGFYEFSFSEGTGTTDVTISDGTLKAVAPHTVTMDWSGVNSVTSSGMIIDRAATHTLDSACAVTDSKWSNSGQIVLGGADISGSSILTPTVAADEGAVFDDRTTTAATDLTELEGCTFSQGTNAHHAIRFGVNVDDDLTLTNCDFSGFSASQDNDGSIFRFDATTGTLNLNLVNCTHDGSGFTVDDAAGVVVTVVVDPVTTKFTVQDENSTVVASARVFAETADNGGGSGFPYQAAVTSLTQSAGTATLTATGNHDLSTGDQVVVRGAQADGYNKVASITVTGATTFTYTVDSGLGSPATGTPIFSYVPVHGLTNGSGVIQSSKTWPASQGLMGWARKSADKLKESSISVADASGGTDQLITLNPDT